MLVVAVGRRHLFVDRVVVVKQPSVVFSRHIIALLEAFTPPEHEQNKKDDSSDSEQRAVPRVHRARLAKEAAAAMAREPFGAVGAAATV